MMNHAKKIYILLTDTGTLFTKLIRLYTKAPFNHVSISFDQELKEVYSFGRKKPYNPLIGGFVKENIQGPLFKRAKCALYCCTVDPIVYDQVRSYVQKFEENCDAYKYNLMGLFGIMFSMDFKRENAYFCSQFVASVFHENGVDLVGKCSAFTTPADFEKSESLQLMYIGKLCDYRSTLASVPSAFMVNMQFT